MVWWNKTLVSWIGTSSFGDKDSSLRALKFAGAVAWRPFATPPRGAAQVPTSCWWYDDDDDDDDDDYKY